MIASGIPAGILSFVQATVQQAADSYKPFDLLQRSLGGGAPAAALSLGAAQPFELDALLKEFLAIRLSKTLVDASIINGLTAGTAFATYTLLSLAAKSSATLPLGLILDAHA